MMQSRSIPSNFVRRLTREKLLLILETAADVSAHRFLRQTALQWLSSFPGDLVVNLLLARALLAEGRPTQAQPILEKLVRLDPEFADAQHLLSTIAPQTGTQGAALAQANAHVVSKSLPAGADLPTWVEFLRAGRTALVNGQLDEADVLTQQVLAEEPESILAAILHLQLASARRQTETVLNLARVYRTRWPDCLQFSLLLADAQLETGDEAAAVILLHHCVVNDAAAQVPEHLWGNNFPYHPLWPEEMEIGFDLPVPADIAARLGWNLLPAFGTPTAEEMFAVVPPLQVTADENIPATPKGDLPADGEPVFPFLEALLHREEEQGPSLDGAADADTPMADPPEVSAGVSALILEQQAARAAQVSQAAQPVQPSVDEPPSVEPVSGDPVPDMAAGRGGTISASAPEPAAEAHGFPSHRSDLLSSVEEELEKVAKHLKKTGLGRADGRYPIYVIFTTRAGLLAQYGSNTLGVVEKEMARLADVVRRRPGWGSLVYCPDDGEVMARLGLQTVATTDPWKLKLALADLDRALAKKGQMIGALLIVGGPDVVPFHHLPNPTDDHDADVPSDNPYATLDSNYFVQDWPVGRLPGESGQDAGLLLEQLRQVTRYHSKSSAAAGKGGLDFWERLQVFLNSRTGRRATFGYTAAVWRRSSLAVYRQIGDAHSLVASPPQSSGAFRNGKASANTMAYYNLHGVPDAAEWYGQRDQTDDTPGPDYPVAIAPKDIASKGSIPEVVFSEACYGAHINGKCEDQSMALKFLSQGTLALVGSTVVAYGSVTVPLIGADLLGSFFWKRLKAGSPVGEALMIARVDLVREMNKRQGFLDGEDQKTLISFVLYGDPLVTVSPNGAQSKTILRQRVHPEVKTICDRQDDNGNTQPIPAELLKQVKSLVAEYLPGLDQADISVHRSHANCDGKDHTCPTSQIHVSGSKSPDPDRTVVTISNEVRIASHVHHQYARVTLDSRGKMLKLALSR